MNQDIISYYRKLREDEGLRAAYANCESVEQVMQTAVEQGTTLGFSFSKEEAMEIGYDIQVLHDLAANDDELSDFELELISAGSPVSCNNDGD
ncbi:MAG: Nif11-like leader peptide family natural product precursor [Rhodospirillales bacterium]